MKCFSSFIFFSFLFFNSYSADTLRHPKSTALIEFVGNSLIYSLNYEIELLYRGKSQAGLKAGFGYVPGGGNYLIPFEFIYSLEGHNKNYFELGIGLTKYIKYLDNNQEIARGFFWIQDNVTLEEYRIDMRDIERLIKEGTIIKRTNNTTRKAPLE